MKVRNFYGTDGAAGVAREFNRRQDGFHNRTERLQAAAAQLPESESNSKRGSRY
jgi:hypothetical protein